MLGAGEYLEKHLNELDDSWSSPKRIIPYGFGADAKRTLKRVIDDFEVPFIIDADENKWMKSYLGIQITSPKVLKELQQGDKIVITIAKRRYEEIKQVLDNYGLKENVDYCHLSQFVTEWYYRYKHEYCIFTMDMTATTACTLKCRHCNMFIPYHRTPVMIPFENMKESLDLLMERIDYVFTIGILGGEALMNPDLIKIMEYINERYDKRIGQVVITTNSVVIPRREMLADLKRVRAMISISDYSDAIGSKSHVIELSKKLDKVGILYSVMYNRVWCDYGFPETPWDVPASQVRKHMMNCNPGWRGLNDGNFYFCNVAWSAERAGLVNLKASDYVNLSNLPAFKELSKQKLLAYSLGYMKNGFMSFCKMCGGCGADNQRFVLAGEQLNC